MAFVVPEKMYVGYQIRKEGSWNSNTFEEDKEETVLGFATYYEENKAFEKRKKTIDDWAQPYFEKRLDETDPEWDPEGHFYQVIRTPRPEYESVIMDNTLREGFKMAKEVQRCGWGGGNVVWRIEDPSGFELEISSSNMAAIMANGTIINGVIQGKCKWGWNKSGGSRIVLLPESSPPYIEALEDNKLHNAKPIKISDVNIGDEVKLKNGTTATYMGQYYSIELNINGNPDSANYYALGKWQSSKKTTHVFYDEHGVRVIVSPKVVRITKPALNVMTPEYAVEKINTRLRIEEKVNSYSGNANPIAFSVDKVDDSEITTQLVPINKDDLEVIFNHDYKYNRDGLTWQSYPVFFEKNGFFRNWGIRHGCFPHDGTQTVVCTKVDRNRLTLGAEYNVLGEMHKPNRMYGWMGTDEPYKVEQRAEIPLVDVNNAPSYILTIRYKDKLYSPRIN